MENLATKEANSQLLRQIRGILTKLELVLPPCFLAKCQEGVLAKMMQKLEILLYLLAFHFHRHES